MNHMEAVFAAMQQGATHREAICAATGLSVKHAQTAIKNLAFKGRIRLVQVRAAGRSHGRLPGVYEVGNTPKTPAPKASRAEFVSGAINARGELERAWAR